jgi:hypothetical protein
MFRRPKNSGRARFQFKLILIKAKFHIFCGSSLCHVPTPLPPALDRRRAPGKILERMAIADGVILTVKRDLDGKMRATARNWPDAKVIGRNEVIELRNVDGRIPDSAQSPLPRRLGPADRARTIPTGRASSSPMMPLMTAATSPMTPVTDDALHALEEKFAAGGITAPEKLEKVLEKLATTDKPPLTKQHNRS